MKTTKKTLTFAFVLTALLCLLVLSASAYDSTEYGSTGMYYTISNGEVTITDAYYDIETADIPEIIDSYPVTRIGSDAFEHCTRLTSITIPNSVTSIGEYAFNDCTSLTSITIPDSVTSIGDDAFRSCTGLTSVTIPDSVTSIGHSAFNRCTSLTTVTISNSVTSIGGWAFQGCIGLTSVTIPDSVTSIGESAFEGTAWYDSQPYGDVYAGKVYYKYKGTMLSNTKVTIRDGTKGIADEAFENCTGLTSVTIPDGVTSIGRYVFYDCTGLTSVTIPDSVTSIDSGAFYCCTRLTSVTIPDSVTSIGDAVFYGCLSLTSITIPNSVTSIDYMAFYNCPITTLKIGEGLKSIGENAFGGIGDINEIYYAGSEAEWKNISIDSSNDLILRATMHYNADLSHTHNYIETVTKKATCTEDGVKTFTCNCGGTYTEIIPATGHKYVTETYKATCTAIGVSIKKCKSCGTVASVTTTPAKGHTEVTDKAVAATCTQSGKTAGSHCSVCGAVLVAQNDVPATGHSTKTSALLTATETESGILITSCETCGRITGASLINRIESVSLSKTSYTYNGKAQKPKVVIKNSKGKVLTEGKDYTVKYQSGRKNPGTYTVTVTFKGNYSGKKTLTFTIAPKAPTLKATAAKKSAKLSWNKQTGATGYNVYMATSKNGKYKKIATVKSGKVSYTKTGLTKGKTYYFKVAAYTTSGGKTINGAYSAVKSVKVK